MGDSIPVYMNAALGRGAQMLLQYAIGMLSPWHKKRSVPKCFWSFLRVVFRPLYEGPWLQPCRKGMKENWASALA